CLISFFFSSRRRHTRSKRDWSSDVCSSDLKTAYLFRLASAEGAYFGGASSQTVSLATRIGQNIGISFQILDDILDYSDASRLNKPTLEDLATGVYSLPLLLVLNEDSDELHTILANKQDLT